MRLKPRQAGRLEDGPQGLTGRCQEWEGGVWGEPQLGGRRWEIDALIPGGEEERGRTRWGSNGAAFHEGCGIRLRRWGWGKMAVRDPHHNPRTKALLLDPFYKR